VHLIEGKTPPNILAMLSVKILASSVTAHLCRSVKLNKSQSQGCVTVQYCTRESETIMSGELPNKGQCAPVQRASSTTTTMAGTCSPVSF
jgi:hypothetical protein